MFDEIQRNLSHEWRDAQTDMETFKQWTDRKINTYIDPSIRTTHRKPKEYYSIEVVKYV